MFGFTRKRNVTKTITLGFASGFYYILKPIGLADHGSSEPKLALEVSCMWQFLCELYSYAACKYSPVALFCSHDLWES